MEAQIGGGPLSIVKHPHFWKAVILFILIVGGIWAWHYFKIRRDVQAEEIAQQQFEAQQKTAPQPKVKKLPH